MHFLFVTEHLISPSCSKFGGRFICKDQGSGWDEGQRGFRGGQDISLLRPAWGWLSGVLFVGPKAEFGEPDGKWLMEEVGTDEINGNKRCSLQGTKDAPCKIRDHHVITNRYIVSLSKSSAMFC